jgi:hypothetical protein
MASRSERHLCASLLVEVGLLIKSVEMASKSSFQDEKRERKRERFALYLLSLLQEISAPSLPQRAQYREIS